MDLWTCSKQKTLFPGLDWTRLGCDWEKTGLDSTGLDWIGVGCISLDCTGLDSTIVEESLKRNYGGGIMEAESSRRNHIKEEPWRRHHGGGIMEKESYGELS